MLWPDTGDKRVHGTTGEAPIERFKRVEAAALPAIAGIPAFAISRDLVRQPDCVVEVDSNAYSVPWRLIGETARVAASDGVLRISHAGREVAVHRFPAWRCVAGFRSKKTAWPRFHSTNVEPESRRPLMKYVEFASDRDAEPA